MTLDRHAQSPLHDITRSQPFSDEAEKGVLSCFLQNPDLLDHAAEIDLMAKCYHPANKLLGESLITMRTTGVPIELVAISIWLTKQKLLDKIGGAHVLAELYSFVPTPAHYPHYRAQIEDLAILRGIIAASTESIQAAYEGGNEPLKVLDEAEQRILAVRPRDTGVSDMMSKHVLGVFDSIEESMRGGGGLMGRSTGFPWLDQMTSGLKPEIWYVGARPSVGKTSFLLQIVQEYVLQGRPVGVFSLEMSREWLLRRMISLLSGVSLARIIGGVLVREEMKAITSATSTIQKSKFLCDDRAGLTASQLRAKARRWKREHKVELIGIDFLQRMAPSDSTKRNRNRTEEHTENSRSCVEGVKELEIPWVVLAQLNRYCEQQKRRPMMSDFEGCGAIEQDADVALMMSPAKIQPEGEEIRHIIWEIAKQRNGATGSECHAFTRHYSKFEKRPVKEIEEPEDQKPNHRGAQN